MGRREKTETKPAPAPPAPEPAVDVAKVVHEDLAAAEDRALDKAMEEMAPPPNEHPPGQDTYAEPDMLAPVKMKNAGSKPWHGSDYAHVGEGYIPAGGEGVVTLRKAQELVSDYGPEGKRGIGPFSLVVEG